MLDALIEFRDQLFKCNNTTAMFEFESLGLMPTERLIFGVLVPQGELFQGIRGSYDKRVGPIPSYYLPILQSLKYASYTFSAYTEHIRNLKMCRRIQYFCLKIGAIT